jgi:hypothetical protein
MTKGADDAAIALYITFVLCQQHLFGERHFRRTPIVLWEGAEIVHIRHSGASRNPGKPTNWTPAFAGVTNKSGDTGRHAGIPARGFVQAKKTPGGRPALH